MTKKIIHQKLFKKVEEAEHTLARCGKVVAKDKIAIVIDDVTCHKCRQFESPHFDLYNSGIPLESPPKVSFKM